MSLVCEFTLVSDALPLTDVVSTLETDVNVERVITESPARPHIVVSKHDFAPDRLEAALGNGSGVINVVSLESTFEETRARVTVDRPVPDVYERLVSLRTYPEGATVTERGWRARTHFASRDDLAAFREACIESGIEFHLTRLFEARADTTDAYGLTPSQHDALVAAFEAGYFAVPREATLADLADELDTTTSALSELLRRGQQQLLSQTVVHPADF
ncbi:helix-turn-helix domain-containing protein [Halorhabdus rudnickae]|uniref:helix-turn-helix domain-containing protein n=1 Tax=Halorhabdus rudnickae TaxID=1775544 RepID=UPI00108294B0|nr:helix-turn-helix domain-containing protein [Halorhabdus rudnickae]